LRRPHPQSANPPRLQGPATLAATTGIVVQSRTTQRPLSLAPPANGSCNLVGTMTVKVPMARM